MAAASVEQIDVTDEVAGSRQLDHESATVGLRTMDLDHAVDDQHQDVGRRTLKKQPKPFRIARDKVVADEFIDELRGQAGLPDPPQRTVAFFGQRIEYGHDDPPGRVAPPAYLPANGPAFDDPLALPGPGALPMTGFTPSASTSWPRGLWRTASLRNAVAN